ncbi:hypothetical protein CR513_35277, partial [Mucuna pruriens]
MSYENAQIPPGAGRKSVGAQQGRLLERLVQEGRLNRYIHKEASENQKRGEEDRRQSQGRRVIAREVKRSRSHSRENIPRHHRGTIATISGGIKEIVPTVSRSVEVGEVQAVLTGVNATPLGRLQSGPVITFDDRDFKMGTPIQDEPMVILVIAVEYKGALYGFAGECVPIKGTVELETVFREGEAVRIIPILYTVIDAEASYNIIIGRPALNRLGAIVSTYHLCMKFPVGWRVGSIWADSRLARRCYEDSLKIGGSIPAPTVNALDFDLDPRCVYEGERPHPAEDVKSVQIGSSACHVTKVGTALSCEEEAQLVSFLRQNVDFLLGPPGICQALILISCVTTSRKQGEERRKAAREETSRLLTAGFIRELQYPTWLANVIMVKKPNGRWRMCTDYTDLNKACPKDPYLLPSIDRLVDDVSGYALLSFMDAYSGYNQIRMHSLYSSNIEQKNLP